MKQPWEWDEADLLALIRDQVQESLTLDYKANGALDRSDAKKNEVSKDVSAFANSAGGTIVYGMVESNHLPTQLDAGFDPQDISREWIEQVINSRIQPRIDGVRIRAVELTTHPGRVAYVVSVPQSVRAPHQAADKRYYRRFNFQSVMMEDYEIRDVARRATRPVLDLEARDIQFGFADSSRVAEARVQFAAHNISSATATFVVVTMGLFHHSGAAFPTTNEWSTLEATDEGWKVFRLVIASGSHRSWSPVTPGFRLVLPYFTLRTPNYERDGAGPRVVGVARIDHDGGARVYRIEYSRTGREGERVRLLTGVGDPRAYLPDGLDLHAHFELPDDSTR